MARSWIGRHSGQRIVEIGAGYLVPGRQYPVIAGELLPTDVCSACGSRNVHVVKTRYPSVNFLEPVRGAPYPTYAAEWAVETKCTCRDCGTGWGRYDFTGEVCPPEHLPYDIYTHERIDEEFK